MIDDSRVERCPVAHAENAPGSLLEALPSVVVAEVPSGEETTLLAQAEGLGRSDVMKKVVGPALTKLLQPLFEEGLSQDELARLTVVRNFAEMEDFMKDVRFMGHIKAEALTGATVKTQLYDELEGLQDKRPDLFYYPNLEGVIRDAVSSGIVTPFTLASQIYIAENFDSEISKADIMKSEISVDAILEVLRRPEFDTMLLKLTKGPNGFLGTRSSLPDISKKHFFSFYDPDKCPEWKGHEEDLGFAEWLTPWNAFKFEEGKVVGLSDQYHLAANLKRKEMEWQWRRNLMSRGRYEFTNSSGCPVRHRFEDETGEKQESLVITAKNFVIDALEVARTQQESTA